MEHSRPRSRRYFLGLGAAVPAALLAGDILAPAVADAADAKLPRSRPDSRRPEPHHRPATEVLMFC
jgi:hypothetical protein